MAVNRLQDCYHQLPVSFYAATCVKVGTRGMDPGRCEAFDLSLHLGPGAFNCQIYDRFGYSRYLKKMNHPKLQDSALSGLFDTWERILKTVLVCELNDEKVLMPLTGDMVGPEMK